MQSLGHAASLSAALRFLFVRSSQTLVPPRHGSPLFWHAIPAVVTLGTDVLQGVVLQSVSDLLRETCLAGKRFPGSPEIAVCHDRDDLAIALAPHERIERSMTDRLGRVGC